MTFGTLLPDNASLAPASGTRLHIDHLPEHGFSDLPHLSHPVAGAAGFKIVFRFGACAVAGVTFNLFFYFKLLLGSKGDLLKGQVDAELHIGSGLPGRTTHARLPASERIPSPENITEPAENIFKADVFKTGSAASTESAVYPLVAKLVVSLPLLGIAKHFIGFRGLLELPLCIRIVGIAIGVEFHGPFPVGFLNIRF